MFGLLRFILASLVVIAHLNQGSEHTNHLGIFAVFGFYIISGYLITRVLHDVYAFDFKTFATNRFLRLYPSYLILSACTLVTLFCLEQAESFHPFWTERFDIRHNLGNLFIFPFAFFTEKFRLVPPAWSVAVEIVCYFLLWLIIARSFKSAVAFLIIAVLYHVGAYFLKPNWSDRYYPVFAALLPFSIGAIIYFAKLLIAHLTAVQARTLRNCTIALWLLNLFASSYLGGLDAQYFEVFFYSNLIVMAALVAVISHDSQNTQDSKIYKLMGDLSYPIFLSHWLVGFLVGHFLLGGVQRGFTLIILSAPFIVLISYVIESASSQLVDQTRGVIRQKARRKAVLMSGSK